MKKVNGEDFFTVADDNQFYIGLARQYLDSTKTKTIDKKSKGKLRFELKSGKQIDINLSKFYWGILLFNGETEPIEVNMTDFNFEFERYMNPKK